MKAKLTAVEVLFVTSWFLCACSAETFFEGKGNAIIAIVAAITTVASAYILSRNNK